MKHWKAIACLLLAHTAAMAAETAPIVSDLSLKQAIAIALEHNHDVKLSALAIRQAEAGTIIANAAPNPTLSIQAVNINQRAAGFGSGSLRDKNMDTTVQITQLIERGGKRELRTETASRLEQASRLDLSDTQRQLQLAVAQAYYDLLAAQDRLRATQEAAGLFTDTLAAAQKREKAGDLAGADVERIRIDVLRARNDARQARADLSKAQLALALLLGLRPPADALQATDSWPGFGQAELATDVERLIGQRPDVKAALVRVDAAISARRLALAARTRDVTVGAQFLHSPNTDNNNTYGISVQIPLFTRYDYDGEIRSAEAALDSARENLEKTRNAARNDIAQSLQDLQSTADRSQRFQQELLIAAKKSADAVEFGFKNGALGVMDVLDARRTYRMTQLDAVAAQADYAKSLAAWRAAVMEEKSK